MMRLPRSLTATALAVLTLAVLALAGPALAAGDGVLAKAREIEARLDARVGIAVLDTGNGGSWGHGADERFPMASTFKVLACGALLAKAEAGAVDPDRRVAIEAGDILDYAPVTERLVGGAASLSELCAATMRTSDNTAANKVLDAIGGPEGLTAFLRAIGDDTTRLDRREPDLNAATPGDPRGTTTPAAMAATLQRLVLGDALSPEGREVLSGWLLGNEVGGPLLRAGIPADWRIGDRTGAGGHGTRGVVAVMWPPGRAPIVAAIYLTGTEASMEARNAAIAEIGRALAADLGP